MAYREYREPVRYRDDPVVVQRAAPAVYDRGDSWTSYAFVKYAFILAITIVILRITWQSWRTVRGHDHHH